jgi:DNA-directed RNA polymerase specialized sigma24 family protein
LAIVLALSGLVVIAIAAYAIDRARPRDRCDDWEQQLEALTESMTRHRTADGLNRLVAIEDLERLELGCSKVAKARDLCAGAYREILLAEDEQTKAKAALKGITRAVERLDDPWRGVARLRVLESAPMESIARELGLPQDEVERTYYEALEKLGRDDVEALSGEFERAMKQSDQHLQISRQRNDGCDRSVKRLLEEAQDR